MRKPEAKPQAIPVAQELPMPKYEYQKSQSGSASAAYREEDRLASGPKNVLGTVHFAVA